MDKALLILDQTIITEEDVVPFKEGSVE